MQAKPRYSIAVGTELVCRILEISPDAMLQKARIDATSDAHAEFLFTAEEYFATWNAAVALTKRRDYLTHLGLAMARGPIIPALLALKCAPNMEIGAARLAHFKTLLGPTRMRCFWSDSLFHVEFESADTHAALPGSLAALQLIVFTENTRAAAAHPLQPVQASLSVNPDEAHQVSEYLGVFVEPGRTSISFAAEDAKRPFISENAKLWAVFESDLERQLLSQSAGLSAIERVEATLLGLFAAGRANIDDVCADLGLSRSSLQRRLREEGTTFRDVLQRVRRETSERYLLNTELQVQEISALLGYHDANSFSRSFQQWTGLSPAIFRETSTF